MFTCNNITLLTFTYYLKCILAINMTIIPVIYLLINYIKIIKDKQNNVKINKDYFNARKKGYYYFIMFFLVSLITHNMLNQKDNVCYTRATTFVYHEYKNSYIFLQNKDITNELKVKYLDDILENKKSINIESLILKKEVKEVASNTETANDNKEDVIDNFLNENDYNIQNKVYVVNGVFYYPNYIFNNYNTYSGKNCPSNPQNEGYNNPYGYNNYFYIRLTKFIDEASKNGHKITMSTQGCRTYDTQTYYYNTMVRGRAALPGRSLHGFGIASDLEFYHNDGSVCSGYRNDSNCSSMGWAHTNASRFGLVFPLLNASYKEDWHIEPINKIKY